jgi:AcrR family transcriptional regulator
MKTNRRIGAEDSATRRMLLDAATRLMIEEGYAAVTSRKVAARAGLKPALVHYYFRTMDDLFVALVRRGARQNLARYAGALASPRPLRALWKLSSDPAGVTLTTEF